MFARKGKLVTTRPREKERERKRERGWGLGEQGTQIRVRVGGEEIQSPRTRG